MVGKVRNYTQKNETVQLSHEIQKNNSKWTEKLNRHFFQRENTDGQQAFEKMLITNDQGNANQNLTEVSPETC